MQSLHLTDTRVLERFKTATALLGVTVLAIVAAELLATGAVFIGDSLSDGSGGVDSNRELRLMAASPALRDAEFDPTKLFAEFGDTFLVAYQPYVVWSRALFTGELVNVDANGERLTAHNSTREDALEVWVFGGSTAWGTGAPDDQTIPSHLAYIMNDRGVDTRVRNLGESAYVSTQEVVYLLRELQAGRRPQVVVFYDGVNDSVSAALWPEVAGTHHNLPEIRSRFESGVPGEGAVAPLLRSTGLYRVARSLLDRLGIETAGVGRAPAPAAGAYTTKESARRAADVWTENHRIVAALGEEFGFLPLFVLQPALGVGEKALDASELDILSRVMRDPAKAASVRMNLEFREEVRSRLREGGDLTAVFDLTDLFHSVPEPLYIDWTHISSRGNRLVAEAVFETLKRRLCQRTPAGASELTRSQLGSACR